MRIFCSKCRNWGEGPLHPPPRPLRRPTRAKLGQVFGVGWMSVAGLRGVGQEEKWREGSSGRVSAPLSPPPPDQAAAGPLSCLRGFLGLPEGEGGPKHGGGRQSAPPPPAAARLTVRRVVVAFQGGVSCRGGEAMGWSGVWVSQVGPSSGGGSPGRGSNPKTRPARLPPPSPSLLLLHYNSPHPHPSPGRPLSEPLLPA